MHWLIVYGVSNHKTMTPKPIGLDLALHQATRSETLMQLFNAEKRAIGIKTVHGIDNAIVKYVLTNLSQIDMCMSLVLLTQKVSYNCNAILLMC